MKEDSFQTIVIVLWRWNVELCARYDSIGKNLN